MAHAAETRSASDINNHITRHLLYLGNDHLHKLPEQAILSPTSQNIGCLYTFSTTPTVITLLLARSPFRKPSTPPPEGSIPQIPDLTSRKIISRKIALISEYLGNDVFDDDIVETISLFLISARI